MYTDVNVINNETRIYLDQQAAYFMLCSIAIQIITVCRQSKIDIHIQAKDTVDLPYYGELVSEFMRGENEPVIEHILLQNADVLYQFVRYIIYHPEIKPKLSFLEEKSLNGQPAWRLITQALYEYQKHITDWFMTHDNKIPSYIKKYDGYNESFDLYMSLPAKSDMYK